MNTDQNREVTDASHSLATLLSAKTDTKMESIIRDERVSFNDNWFQFTKIIINIQAPNTTVSIHIKQKLTDCRKKLTDLP